ncbi:MAG: Ig-like domain-containing protein [archaeon]|nr:Ig-like domain-containing protein [archaeon]
MTKHCNNDADFTVRILDYRGNPIPHAPVKFNNHGIIYHTFTDIHGFATYPTGFKQPGEYTITTICDGICS